MKFAFQSVLFTAAISLNCVFGQQDSNNSSFYFTPEFQFGKTVDANTGFPDTNLQTGLALSLGWFTSDKEAEWTYRLKKPKTGILLAIIDFGNSDKVGQAFSLIPYGEIPLFRKWSLNVGMGVSYMNTLYDPETNPFNEGITTKLNWSYRSFVYYPFKTGDKIEWRLGLGYFHHSNGHTRLPNQGLNSFLGSISAQVGKDVNDSQDIKSPYESSAQTYFSTRLSGGLNVLSEEFNSKKGVYTFAFEFGKIINRTFKFGGGAYYRFYQQYYDYIKDGEELITTREYRNWQDKPFLYASAYGIYGSAELLLGHVGFEVDIGFNIHKPFYQIDWILNQGFTYQDEEGNTIEVPGRLDDYYEVKRSIASRLGLKYYLVNNDKSPQHNFYIGAHINANLGQADFTDLSFGYVRRFKKKD